MIVDGQDMVECMYCGTLTSMAGTRQCNNCWEVVNRINAFVLSDLGLLRALEAISRRPPARAGALAMSEAVALGTSGQAGRTGQLLAAELLVMQTTLANVRSALHELEVLGRKEDPLFPLDLDTIRQVVSTLRAALGEP